MNITKIFNKFISIRTVNDSIRKFIHHRFDFNSQSAILQNTWYRHFRQNIWMCQDEFELVQANVIFLNVLDQVQSSN